MLVPQAAATAEKPKAPAKAKVPPKAKAPKIISPAQAAVLHALGKNPKGVEIEKKPPAKSQARPRVKSPLVLPANLLGEKAVLASLTIRSWSTRKFDSDISKQVDEQHGTENAGRYNKRILISDLRTAISHISQNARSTHHRLTKPWLDEGPRILPTALLMQHADAMRRLKADHEKAREAFYSAYPELIEQSKARLKKMFDPEDYPPVEELRGRFDFIVQLAPIPDSRDFRIDIESDALKEMRADLDAKMQTVLRDSMQDTRAQIIEVVSNMAAKLGNYNPEAEDRKDRGIFHNSLVENMRELVELLPAFNLTNDTTLSSVIARMQKELCNEEAKELRDNETVRKTVQKSAEDILAQVQEFMT